VSRQAGAKRRCGRLLAPQESSRGRGGDGGDLAKGYSSPVLIEENALHVSADSFSSRHRQKPPFYSRNLMDKIILNVAEILLLNLSLN
jgi:hypothetical protein